MKTIPFTQFLRPNGRRKPVTLDVSDEAAARFYEAEKLGCRMTVEELTTGEASLCVEHEDGDVDCVVVPNGPGVREAVEAMLLRFSLESFNAWHKEMTEPDPSERDLEGQMEDHQRPLTAMENWQRNDEHNVP